MSNRFNELYRKVPKEQREELRRFRATHPFKRIVIAGRKWEYLCSPAQEETILFLVGGLSYAEFAFQHIMALEENYRVVTPSYGPAPTIEGTLQAIIAMLDREGVEKAHVAGQSLGGLIAQCLVRKYPNRFETMILSNTTAPAEGIDPELRRKRISSIKKKVTYMRWFPYWVIRRVIGWKFAKLLSIDADKAEFWKAFLMEAFQYNITKQDMINTSRIMIDLAENYTFAKGDLRKWLGRILLIGSDYDPAFDPVELNALKGLYPQAEKYTFQGTGHLAILARQDEYLKIVTSFIRSSRS
jgi:pimeloyl-ACP methyl ester carboxylesterase